MWLTEEKYNQSLVKSILNSASNIRRETYSRWYLTEVEQCYIEYSYDLLASRTNSWIVPFDLYFQFSKLKTYPAIDTIIEYINKIRHNRKLYEIRYTFFGNSCTIEINNQNYTFDILSLFKISSGGK